MADIPDRENSQSPTLDAEEALGEWKNAREESLESHESWQQSTPMDPMVAAYIMQQSLIQSQNYHLVYLELEKVKTELAALRGAKNSKKKVGFLNVIQSCMFGGKTTHLFHLLDSYSRSHECLYVNHALDKRSDEGYSTHNEYLNPELAARLKASRVTMAKVASLAELPEEFLRKFKVVCIDEAQFFPDLVPGSLRMIEELGVETLCVAGLTLTFKRQPFGKLLELSGHADYITLLRDTPCNPCAARGKRRVAIYSHLQREKSTSEEEIQIGSDQYLPVCRKCFLERTAK